MVMTRRIHQRRRTALVAFSLLILSIIFYNPIDASSRKSVPFTPKHEENVAFRTTEASDQIKPKSSKNAADQNHRRRRKSSHREDRKRLNLSKYFDSDSLDDFDKETILTRRSESASHEHHTSRSSTGRTRTKKSVYPIPSSVLTPHQEEHQRNQRRHDTISASSTDAAPTPTSDQPCRLLQVPLSIALQHDTSHGTKSPMKTFLDTGAQVTIMTYESVKRAGIAHLIDTRYAGHASGVAGVSCRVLGRIPARTVSFLMEGEGGSVQVLDNTPAITVLEDKILGGKNHDGVDMLMGLDILEEWRATLCLEQRTLTARGATTGSKKTVVIPLTQGSTRTSTTSRTAVVATCTSTNSFVDESFVDELEPSSYCTKKKDSNQDEEEEEYKDDNYYFAHSDDEFDECDLSGV